jgi:hypothetical protein
MKYAAVAFVMVMLGAAAGSGAQTAPTPRTITLAATVVDVRESADMRSDLVLLWNRNVRSRPLGHGVLTCTKVGTGGLLGGGISNCVGTYQLPLGKIAVQGILHGYARYTLVVTGGTSRYKDAQGTLFVRRVADGVRRLTFLL